MTGFDTRPLRLSALALCLAVLGGCANSEAAGSGNDVASNCSLWIPPLDSGTNRIHGARFFIFPRTLRKDYSGCQTMWDQNGRQWMKLLVEKGRPAKLTMNVPDTQGASRKVICNYEVDQLVGESDECPAYEKGQDFGNLAFPADEINKTDEAYRVLLKLRRSAN